MNKNNFDPNFNPSPFDDLNKDLNESLREIEIKNKEIEDTLLQLFHFLLFYKGQEKFKTEHKVNQWPLMFIVVNPDSKLDNKNSWPEMAIFMATLERKNKDLVLGFAYDWLIEHKQILITTLKEKFIEDFWQKNFEQRLL